MVVKENGDPARDEDIIATVVKNGDQWEYFFKVKDTDASYYGWEPEMPDGYQTEGKGTRKDPVKSGEEYTLMEEKQYSHTPNISDDGVKTGHYAKYGNIDVYKRQLQTQQMSSQHDHRHDPSIPSRQ